MVGEGKDYVSRPDEMGSIHISEEVLAVIASAAAQEVEGVGGLVASFSSDFAEFLGKKSQCKGIHLLVSGETVTVDVSILVKYGFVIPDVARKVQDAVMSSVQDTSGLTVAAVNITVSGIVFGKELHKAQ